MYKTNLLKISLLAIVAIISTFTTTQAQNRAYTGTDRQLQTLLERIETQTDAFSREIDRSLDRSSIDGTTREDSITSMVSNFEQATDTLRDNFTTRRSSASDVQEVLNRAISINTFMQNNRVTTLAQRQWSQLRNELNLLASNYRVTSNWNAVNNNYGNQTGRTVSDAQIITLIRRIKTRSNSFRLSVGRLNRGNTRETAAEITQELSTFDVALDDLNRSLNQRNYGNGNIQNVLEPASSINGVLSSNRTNNDVTNKWNLLRSDLTTLAGYYRVRWNGDTIITPGDQWGQNNNFDSRLTGTYRLNTAQSDNVATIVDRAINDANYQANQTDRIRRNLERRLASPETMSFQKNGQQVTMSSANAAAITLAADGRNQTETSPNGRTVTTNVTATNRDLTISYEGDRINDYNVVFTPVGNRQLRVTRRIYLENQSQTVTVTSVYDKTSQTPDWNTVGNTNGTTSDGFAVPNNTRMTATLNTALSTRTIRDRDQFSMTVTSPSQFNGAVITGTVNGDKSGMVSGRANMSLTFDTIRLTNGNVYRFAGIVDEVRSADGNTVNVNNEGAIRDGNQTTKTVTRAGIGAVLGAIIGAIAGGGEGAAIGAGVGAGAGVGTVILQGRDNLELGVGTTFAITATAPANTR
ncbi:MAG: hypothetical protein KA956_01065 [Pyrinomonadaceae bacterium]|nr:hypothetical protein [Pyrinomonadaceae bacterium]